MSPDPRLRAATAGDIPAIMALERRDDMRAFISAWSADEHRANLADSDKRYWIIETGGAWTGFAILCGYAKPGRSIELARIAVERPGDGSGRAALRALIAKVLDEEGAHRLWLDVFVENARARQVYRALGFVEEGTLREAHWDGERQRSLVIMALLASDPRRRGPR